MSVPVPDHRYRAFLENCNRDAFDIAYAICARKLGQSLIDPDWYSMVYGQLGLAEIGEEIGRALLAKGINPSECVGEISVAWHLACDEDARVKRENRRREEKRAQLRPEQVPQRRTALARRLAEEGYGEVDPVRAEVLCEFADLQRRL